MDIDQTTYNIHVFGDFQSCLYSSPYLSNYICNVYYVGPVTMDRVGRDNLTIDKLKDLSKEYYKNLLPTAKPEYKHMSYPKNDTINNNDLVIYVFGEINISNDNLNLVNNYIKTILLNKEKYNVKYGVQSINGNNEINKLLKQSCEKNNILFIDINSNPFKNNCDKSNSEINMDNPESIEYAFKLNCIPINIKYYNSGKKCKYPSGLNKFQRDYYKRVRIGHYILMIILYASLLVPYSLILIPITLWASLFIFNYIFSGDLGNCFINVVEIRSSNCNDKQIDVELGFKKKDNVIIYFYIISILIILYRVYKHNKTIFTNLFKRT
jgi:hypothetical protein